MELGQRVWPSALGAAGSSPDGRLTSTTPRDASGQTHIQLQDSGPRPVDVDGGRPVGKRGWRVRSASHEGLVFGAHTQGGRIILHRASLFPQVPVASPSRNRAASQADGPAQSRVLDHEKGMSQLVPVATIPPVSPTEEPEDIAPELRLV